MKNIITVIFLFLFVSCNNCLESASNDYTAPPSDRRCEKLLKETYKKGIEIGVCHKFPEGKAIFESEAKKLDPDHKACRKLFDKAQDKCRALPPPSPDDTGYFKDPYIFIYDINKSDLCK